KAYKSHKITQNIHKQAQHRTILYGTAKDIDRKTLPRAIPPKISPLPKAGNCQGRRSRCSSPVASPRSRRQRLLANSCVTEPMSKRSSDLQLREWTARLYWNGTQETQWSTDQQGSSGITRSGARCI